MALVNFLFCTLKQIRFAEVGGTLPDRLVWFFRILSRPTDVSSATLNKQQQQQERSPNYPPLNWAALEQPGNSASTFFDGLRMWSKDVLLVYSGCLAGLEMPVGLLIYNDLEKSYVLFVMNKTALANLPNKHNHICTEDKPGGKWLSLINIEVYLRNAKFQGLCFREDHRMFK